ncbi:hypothetical protein D9M68_894060 [compost metagenome]
MSAYPFSSRLNHNIRPVINRAEEITGGAECIIYDQGQVVFAGYSGNFFEIRYTEGRVTNGFYINRLGTLINLRLKC